jgi:hypothetical protein
VLQLVLPLADPFVPLADLFSDLVVLLLVDLSFHPVVHLLVVLLVMMIATMIVAVITNPLLLHPVSSNKMFQVQLIPALSHLQS